MATLKIDYLKRTKENGFNVVKSICVVGRKMSYVAKKRNYGKEYAESHEIYYVAKSNEMGIKWVMVDLTDKSYSDICTIGASKLRYDDLRVNVC